MSERHTVTTTLEFPYRRSLGTVVGRFMTALKDGRILGARTAAGAVLVPPLEYDPATAEAVDPDLVEVGPGGVVTSWTWVATPSSRHPLDHPFAFALIQLDGATTSIVHVLDTGSADVVHTGLRVTPRWREERVGAITDIEAFVPEGASA